MKDKGGEKKKEEEEDTMTTMMGLGRMEGKREKTLLEKTETDLYHMTKLKWSLHRGYCRVLYVVFYYWSRTKKKRENDCKYKTAQI